MENIYHCIKNFLWDLECKLNIFLLLQWFFWSSGDAKQVADIGGQETSSVVVETVSKVAKNNNKGPVMPTFKSDASKVQSKGMGLKKAYIGKQNQFTVSAANAGKFGIRTKFQGRISSFLHSYMELTNVKLGQMK